MPLNYSKWDQLELSDDSDIEGHPNVDKRSLIKWKQRDIHEKRENRKAHITQLREEIAVNDGLLSRLPNLIGEVESNGSPAFTAILERLKTNPSSDKPEVGNITYDFMIENLLRQVEEAVQKDTTVPKEDAEYKAALVKELNTHLTKLKDRQVDAQKDLDSELKEQAKHITSDDLHEGFDSGHVNKATDTPKPLTTSSKAKMKTTETHIEVLNPKAESSSSSSAQAPAKQEDEDEDEDEELPELTPSLLQFSKIGIRQYDKSFAFIQGHRDVIVEGATDALLVAGFNAQMKGDSVYAKQSVHQGLLIQYCEKLGKDGVSLFFKRMAQAGTQAEKVFLKDVEDTYALLRVRAEKARTEEEPREQIQLVQEEGSNKTIEFNVPDGPPPEHLILEGPGTEDMDVEEVRKSLQARWDIFTGFPQEFQDALNGGTLEAVNKVLGDMSIPQAEDIVQLLQISGMLQFAEEGIREVERPLES